MKNDALFYCSQPISKREGVPSSSAEIPSSQKKKQTRLKFETLKGRAQEIVMRLTNSIALHNEDCCAVEDFAEEFHTASGRLRTTLKRLEEAGLITLIGDVTQLVVPTVKLLRRQDRHLSEDQA